MVTHARQIWTSAMRKISTWACTGRQQSEEAQEPDQSQDALCDFDACPGLAKGPAVQQSKYSCSAHMRYQCSTPASHRRAWMMASWLQKGSDPGPHVSEAW